MSNDLATINAAATEPLLNSINNPTKDGQGERETSTESATSESATSESATKNMPFQFKRLTLVHKVLLLLTCGILLGSIVPKNPDLPTPAVQYLSSIIGYTYFLCWSISFYPQVILNYKRKNTTGLSPDFSVLNVVGFMCYSIYTAFLFWSPAVKEQYHQRFHSGNDNDDGSKNESDTPVAPNDVAFAFHAFILSFIQVGQIVYYQQQRRRNCAFSLATSLLSMLYRTTKLFLLFCVVLCIIIAILVGNNVHGLIFLDYLYMLSTIKLCITIIKYIPQVMMNYQRKSTVGWNIWNVLLDFSGGLLSLVQLFLDAWAMDDFSAITGNWVKFALSFVSLFFDVVFLVQHYVLYPHHPDSTDLDYTSARTNNVV